jgi:hypothetical protein
MSYQLSVISYQLSVISYQLSVIKNADWKLLVPNRHFLFPYNCLLITEITSPQKPPILSDSLLNIIQ